MARGLGRNLVGRKGFQQGARGRATCKEGVWELLLQKWLFPPGEKRRGKRVGKGMETEESSAGSVGSFALNNDGTQ